MRTFILAALGCLLSSIPAAAQAPEPSSAGSRADFQTVLGWQNLRLEREGFDGPDHNWAHAILYAGAGVSWYWNDHLKTQVDVGADTPGRHYRYRVRNINGFQTSETSRLRVTRPSVAIAQQYQFFRNEWFHPRIGIGVDIARETRREEYDPVWGYDTVARMTRELVPARTEAPEHRTLVRPFVETGFKTYMTRRAFFTGDLRLMVHKGIDQVLFRGGFGIDF